MPWHTHDLDGAMMEPYPLSGSSDVAFKKLHFSHHVVTPVDDLFLRRSNAFN
jgi:hypothetical protein